MRDVLVSINHILSVRLERLASLFLSLLKQQFAGQHAGAMESRGVGSCYLLPYLRRRNIIFRRDICPKQVCYVCEMEVAEGARRLHPVLS